LKSGIKEKTLQIQGFAGFTAFLAFFENFENLIFLLFPGLRGERGIRTKPPHPAFILHLLIFSRYFATILPEN